MVTTAVVVIHVLRYRGDFDEASSESLPDYGAGVNIGGVFGRRGPPWRRCVEMLPALVCVFQVETFLRFFGGAMMAHRCRFLIEGVALEVMGLRRLWCCVVLALEDGSEF
jgi:hypothetical protein